MTDQDELLAVLRHDGPPRHGLYLELPTSYGSLRLDGVGDDPQRFTEALTAPVPDQLDQVIADAFGRMNETGDPGPCVEMMRQIAAAHPLLVAPYANLRWLYARAGRRDEALYFARQAVALDPSHARLASLANSFAAAGLLDRARLVYAHLWAHRAELADPAVYEMVVQDYLHMLLSGADWPTMREVADEVVAEHPRHVTGGFHLALASYRLDLPEQASAALDVIEPITPHDSVLYPQIGRLRRELGELKPDEPSTDRLATHTAAIEGMDEPAILEYLTTLVADDPDAAVVLAHDVTARNTGSVLLNYRLGFLLQEHSIAAAMVVIDRAFARPDFSDRALAMFLPYREALDRLLGGGTSTWGLTGPYAGSDGRSSSAYADLLRSALMHPQDLVGTAISARGPAFGELALVLPAEAPDVAGRELDREQTERFTAELDQLTTRWKAGDLPGARAHAVDLARRYPYQPQAHHLASELSARLADGASAIFEARQAVAVEPGYRALLHLARLLRHFTGFRLAVTVLDHLWINRAREADRDLVRAVLADNLAALNSQAAHPLMVGLCQEAISEDAENVVPWYYLGVAQLGSGDAAAARSTVDRALARLGHATPLAEELTTLSAAIERALSRTGG